MGCSLFTDRSKRYWASCIAAYEALDDEYKSLIENLTAEHDIAAAFTDSRYGATPEAREQLAAAREKNPPMRHPVVRTHTVSGKRGIYVNQSFTTRIIELEPKKIDSHKCHACR